MMVPNSVLVVPSVADEPTCQKMFLACADPASTIARPEDMIRVVAIWKMKMPFSSPTASKVKSPLETSNPSVDL